MSLEKFNSPVEFQPQRFIGMDIDKHTVVIVGLDPKQKTVRGPCRIGLRVQLALHRSSGSARFHTYRHFVFDCTTAGRGRYQYLCPFHLQHRLLNGQRR